MRPVSEPQAGIWRHTGVDYKLVLNSVVPQMAEQLVEVFLLLVECKSPAPAMFSPAPVSIAVSSPVPVVEKIAPTSAVISSPAPTLEHLAPAPAVLHALVPSVEYLAPAPALSKAPALGVEYISPAPAGLLPVPVVKYLAPAPASEAPAPVEEYISPTSAFLPPAPVVENIAPEPSVSHSPAPVVDSISPAPAFVQSPTPVVEFISPARAVFHAPTALPARSRAEVFVGGLQGSVPGQSSSGHRGDEQAEVPSVTLLLRKGTDSKRCRMPPSQPLRYVFQAHCRRLGLQESQVRFSCDGLLSADHSPDQFGLVDGDVFCC